MLDVYLLLSISLIAIIGVCVGLLRRQHGLREEIESLTREMSAFTAASIRVADTLDRAMTTATPPSAARSARRQVVGEARARLAAGRSADQIGVELGLSEDERALLAALPPISVGVR